MFPAILIIEFDNYRVQAKVIHTENGDSLCSFQRRFELIRPGRRLLEANPDDIWDTACESVRAVMELCGNDTNFQAVSFSFTGEGLFVLDREGRPLMNELLLQDRRAVREGNELSERFSTPEAHYSHLSVASKVLYLKRNRTDIFHDAAYFVSLQQFIFARLGLPLMWDRTMASCHSFFDIKTGAWNPEILEAAGVTEELLGGEIRDSHEVVGTIRRFGPVELGREIPVVLGGHDGDIGLLGLGITDPSQEAIGEVAGTYDHVGFLTKFDPSKAASLHRHPGPYADSVVIMKAHAEFYTVVKWFMREIAQSPSEEAFERMFDRCSFDGRLQPVRFSPHFHEGQGAFAGLSINVTKYDLFKAMMQALTFESRRLIEWIVDEKAEAVSSLRIGGDAARSDAWLQLKADVTGLTVSRMSNSDISAVGAAILAAWGSSIYGSLSEAIGHMTEIKDICWPNSGNHARYDRLYRAYIAENPEQETHFNPGRYV